MTVRQYLRLEGEHTDLRTVRRTIAWIRDAFAAAAIREDKPGTAILLDPDRIASAPEQPKQPNHPKPPTLAEFAQARGMEDFSEGEQLEAYEDAYAPTGRGGRGGSAQPSRRARVIERQLEALRWLQGLAAQDPRPGDSVVAWLNPSLASRLERAGLPTLLALVERVNGIGARWWVQVPGVGELKAARILDWLHANEEVLGLRVGVHVAQPRAQLTPAALAAVVPAATAIRPLEKFVLPGELDGSAGRFRAPPGKCLLTAADEAIGAWLSSKRPGHADGALSSTQRSYRKEAERLLLWAILERKKALSSLTLEDETDFCGFFGGPPESWCGPRHHQRWSPLWRPLEGPSGTRGAAAVDDHREEPVRVSHAPELRMGNPLGAVTLPSGAQRPLGSSRTLTFAQWDYIDKLLQDHGDTQAVRRLRRGMRWLYATGLRLAEITSVKCEDLAQVEYTAGDGAAASDWLLSVIGKGGRTRQVPVPAELVEELGDELARHGFERQVGAVSNQGIYVMARFDSERERRPAAWSASGLYQAIKAFLAQAADSPEGVDAQELRKASTHWQRHSHGSHALQGREGQAPVPLQIVQNNLGHVSVGTTSMYLATERDERLKAMRRFWKTR